MHKTRNTGTDLPKQDDSRQTGCSFNFCSITERLEIPTATSRFSGSAVSTDLSPTSADNDQDWKFRMAVAKRKVIIYLLMIRTNATLKAICIGI